MTEDFLLERMKPRDSGVKSLKHLKEQKETCQPRILYPVIISFKKED